MGDEGVLELGSSVVYLWRVAGKLALYPTP